MTGDEITERIETAWAAWLAALDGIPEAVAIEPGACGYYSVKDLVGHIAFWDERDLERAHKIARGEAVQPNDWAVMNDQDYEAHKNDSFDAQTARMIGAHTQLETDLATFAPLDDRLRLSESWEHYDVHRADVLAWRVSKGI